MAGEVVPGGIVAQTEQVIENIKAVLALAGCGLEDVIKVTCWLDDPRDFSSFNAVFEKHFIDHPPARSTVQSRLMEPTLKWKSTPSRGNRCEGPDPQYRRKAR